MKKILITGAAGFIGYNLAQKLAKNPENHLCLADNLQRGRNDDVFTELTKLPNVRFLQMDLSTPSAFEKLDKGFDEVYHLAAVIGVSNVMERPYDVVRLNALTTLHLLDWMAQGGAEKILFSSTSEAYGWTQQFHKLPIPTPEEVPLALTEIGNPRSSYAGSKIFGELAVTHACQTYKKKFTIVRYHNVYGPRMGYNHVIPELFGRITNGESPLTVYNAHHTRAFCHIDDAVTATQLAMESPAADGATINIGNDKEITIEDLATRMIKIAGVNCEIRTEAASHDPINRRCPDISRARELIGYKPSVTLDEGLASTMAWYRTHPKP
ncbi:MAG: NAD-dependent epimerase/dehydratase family protein [Chthoniobacterales bacterium]